MSLEWIIIEILTIIIDITMNLYFLNSRLPPATKRSYPKFLAWGAAVLLLSMDNVSLVDLWITIIFFIYLYFERRGSIAYKIFWLIIYNGILLGVILIGGYITSLITDTHFAHSRENQDSVRILSLIIIKSLQITLLYLLAKRRFPFYKLKRSSVIVLLIVALTSLTSMFLIFFYSLAVSFSTEKSMILLALSGGFLIVICSTFVIFELFLRDTEKIMKTSQNIQKLELEKQYNSELNLMFSDIMRFRHDYKNHLIALQGLAEKNEYEELQSYVKKLQDKPERLHFIVDTGNAVLDAIIASKLELAKTLGINVICKVNFPRELDMEPSDLTTIVGNLLDNAIEACKRIDSPSAMKFINFSITTVKKHLAVTVINSTDDIEIRDGEKYLTRKKDYFHGMGLFQIDEIVDKYEGYAYRKHQNCVFESIVHLPIL